MADEVLSQAELETLLSSLESGLAPKARPSASHPLPAPHAPRLTASQPSARPRQRSMAPDASQARDFDREPMAAIRALHEGFGRNFSVALSALLRSVVEVKLAAVEQLTYGEFIARLQNPTCASVVRAAQLNASWVVDIQLSVLYAIIDRLLGGGREPGLVARRPLTDIELRLASRVTKLFLQELKKSWQPVLPIDLSLDRVESNPRLVLSVASREAVVLVSFESIVGDVRGTMTLCMPAGSIEPIINKCAAGTVRVRDGRITSGDATQPRFDKGPHATLNLVVQLADTKIAAQDALNLRVGDIIATEKDIQGPVSVCVQGVEAFRARPGAIQGHKAVCIEEIVQAPNERDATT
jgi:flagellar motor switch protein FliM